MQLDKLTDNQFADRIVFDLVRDEGIRQVQKWGVQTHGIFEWLAYTTEELGELSQAISKYVYNDGTKEDILKEAIHTATLSLKIAEMIRQMIVLK